VSVESGGIRIRSAPTHGEGVVAGGRQRAVEAAAAVVALAVRDALAAAELREALVGVAQNAFESHVLKPGLMFMS
jgi:hypothetical protein